MQKVTFCWKSLYRISGYQGYQLNIRGIMNGYQEKIYLISTDYLTDCSRIFKNICWIYPTISQISMNDGQRVTNLKNRYNTHVSIESNSRISRISNGYQPDINTFCAPDIMSCHPLAVYVVTRYDLSAPKIF